jgi:arylsulfatase A-like enzyme
MAQLVAFSSTTPLYAAEKPNIVLIVADDVGYGDLSCYGATKIKTPHLDKLAAAGLRFTDAHSPSSVCTPTRYALLTGQYAWRHAPGSGILSGIAPLSIPIDRLTLPKLLKQADYVTGVVGKWHLGLGEGEADYNRQIKPGPRDVGFDYSFLIPATGDRVPCVYVENHKVVGYDAADPIRVSYSQMVGDEPTGAKRPDLLTVKPSRGHDNTIIHGISRIGYMSGGKAARWKDEEMADVITQKAVDFIDRHADARVNNDRPFFLYFATHDAHVPRVPHPRFKGTSGHGTRGDVIQQLDWCVGEVLKALEKFGLADNTLVIFTSDNGGVMDDGYQDGSGNDTSGHRCNGALRGFKGQLYEGGHRVPFIARWPAKIKPGTSDQLICHMDLVAACAALLKQELPKGTAPDSINVLPALLGQAKPPVREHLVHHTNGPQGALAIRKGAWKLIPASTGKKGKPASGPQLFNLVDDLGETQNLVEQQADKTSELQELLRSVRAARP